jgi:GAF domain-containing protein
MFIYTFTAYFFISAVVQIVDRSEFTWLSLDQPSIKEIILPNGFEITYYEMTPGPFTNFQSFTSLPIFAFMVWMIIRFFRGGNRQAAVPLLLSFFLFWVGIFNDILVSSGVYNFIYLIEYSFMAILLFMAASLAHQMADVTDSLQRNAQRQSVLHAASQEIIRAIYDQEQVYEAVHKAVGILMPAEAFVIALCEESTQETILPYLYDKGGRWPDQRFPLGKGLTGHVLRTGNSLLISDFSSESNIDVIHFGHPDHIRSILAVPLRSGNELIGMLSTQSYQKDVYTDEDQTILEMLAAYASSALENLRLFTETKRRGDEFVALYEATRSLNTLTDLQSLLQNIISNATTLLNASSGGMYLFNPTSEELELVIAKDDTVPVNSRLKIGEGLAGHVALTREPIIIDDYRVWEGRSKAYKDVPFRAVLEVPMIFSGELVGVLAAYETGRSTRKFTEEDARLLLMLATQAASAVHETRQFEKIRKYLNELETVKRLSSSLRAAQTLNEMLPILLNETLSILKTTAGCIWLYDSESDSLRQLISRGWFTGISEPPMQVSEGIGGNVYATGEVYHSREFVSDPCTLESARSQIPAGWGGVCLPIRSDNEVIGVGAVFAFQFVMITR